MSHLNPLPTHIHHNTTRLTHGEAHTILSSFLDQTEIDAAYRPDSTLTERGPQSTSTGTNPNLTLHHLKLILLGLEGKRMKRAEPVDIDSPEESNKKSKKNNHVKNKKGVSSLDGVDETEEGWQEKEEYEHEQDDSGLQVMDEDRHPGANLTQPRDEVEEEELVQVEIEATGEKVDSRLENQSQQVDAVEEKGKRKKDKKDREERKKRKLQKEKG